MGFGLAETTMNMGNFYNSTMSSLSTSLTRIASGKNYSRPSDGIIEFMRVDRTRKRTQDFTTIHHQLTEGLNMSHQAETVGQSIVDNIQAMKKTAYDYWAATDPTAKSAYQSTFNGLKTVVNTLINGDNYSGVNLMQVGTVSSIGIDPNDPTQNLSLILDANDIVGTAGMDVNLGSEAATIGELDTQLGHALSYLSKNTGYMHSLDAQSSVAQSMIDNGNSFEQDVNGVDTISEMNNVTAQDIRQQAALAMISQGNMYRLGVLQLLKF